MRVHQIINDIDLDSGGAQKLALQLHKYLSDLNLTSFLVGISKNKIPNKGKIFYTKLKTPYSLKYFIFLYKYMKSNVKDHDIIHVHLFPSILYISIFKSLGLIPKNTRILMTEHNSYNRRRSSVFGKFLDYFIYYQFNQIIAISDGVRNSLSKHINNSKKIFVIHNGIEIKFKKFQKRKKNKKIRMISVGRLHVQKNYENILLAISKIKELDFEYSILGSGNKEKYISIINSLEIEDKVKILGFRNDIPEILKKTDIFIMASKWEGFGLAAVEAMNSGLACIYSNVEGLRELFLGNEFDGLKINPSDSDDIAEKIKKLVENYDLRQKLGKNAHDRSKAYSVQKMLEKYLKLYEA